MLGQVLGELETGKLVIGGDPPHKAGALQVHEMAISRAAREIRETPGDVPDADRVPGIRQELHDRASTWRVPLVDAAEASLGQVVQAIGRAAG